MAVITRTIESINGAVVVTWAGMNAGDTGAPYEPAARRGLSASVQFLGTSVTNVALQQSNNMSAYHNVKDMAGNDVIMAAPGMAEISNSARAVAPKVTGGTSVTCIMVFRG